MKAIAMEEIRRAAAAFVARAVPAPNGCLLWTGARTLRGYGNAKVSGVFVRPHRVIVAARLGRVIAPSEIVRHRCDNPPCILDEHLILGTHSENVADAVMRGRHSFGARVPSSKLTDAQVASMRAAHEALGLRACDLGPMFGVKAAAAAKVLRRYSWRHVDFPTTGTATVTVGDDGGETPAGLKRIGAL